MEGALGTPDIWFGSNNQDAGIPCVFQVFRPFQPLHTLVSYRGFHSRDCPLWGRFSHLPGELPQPPSRPCGGVFLHPRVASTAAVPPLRGLFSSLPKSFHSLRPAPAGAFSPLPKGFHSRRSRPCGGVFLHSRVSSTAAGLAPAGAFFFTPEELPQPSSRPCGGVFSTPQGLPQPPVSPLRGRFSSLPSIFHSRRSRPCGGVFLHSRVSSTAAGLAPAGAFFFTPEYLPQPSSRPCGGVFFTPGGFHSLLFAPAGAFFSLPGASTAAVFVEISSSSMYIRRKNAFSESIF